MIEQQTIDGRPATVAYLTRDFEPATPTAFDYAKVLFDDGSMVILSNDEDNIEAESFNKHRFKHQRPFDGGASDAEGAAESSGYARHRFKHQRPMLPFVLADDGPTQGNVNDIPVKLQLIAWQKAIIVLDASEILVRDLIERNLHGYTGVAAEVRPGRTLTAMAQLVVEIEEIRIDAIKTAFRLLRDHLGNVMVLDTSLAKWAAYFAKIDMRAIEAAMRAALVNGDDSIEIARKVVGTMALNGVDGVTEYTRHKLAHLGRAAIKAYNLRKAGETKSLFDGTVIE